MSSTTSTQQQIQVALGHHRAGRLGEAEKIYRQVLASDAKNVDALHLLGVLAHQVGQNEAATQLISQAIQLGAGAEAYNNLGSAFKAMDNVADAAAAYRKALELNPGYAEALTNLGQLYDRARRFDEAIALHRRALELNPKLADARHNLAMALQNTGKHADAISEWEHALDLEPDHAAALNNLGMALLRTQASVDRATALLRRCTQLRPNDAEAWTNLASALMRSNRTADALAAAQRSVELAPDRAESHNNLGSVLQKLGRLDEAIAEFKLTLSMKPDFGVAHGNLASVYEQLERYDEALSGFQAAARLLPNYPHVFSTLSTLYRNMNRDSESLEAAEKSLALDPTQAEAHGSRAFAMLSVGNLIEGFYEYEWRWRCPTFTSPPRDFDRPMWDGSDPAGRTILVHTEQGFGDVLQMARYLPLLAERGARVYVECFPQLRSLLENVPGISRVIGAGLKLPDFDLHCPVMSLPRAFRTTQESIPKNVPYLAAPEARRALWRKRIEELAEGRFTVGLTWGGNVKPDPKRTCDLKYLAPLADVDGINFISLQTGAPAEQLKDAPPNMRISHLGGELKDFADTAAIIESLDLMITIDTGVAHLAGAVGAATWTMLPYSADWRWLRDREDSDWYPTMRLFRQPSRGDWSSVAARIVEELRRTVASRK